MKNILKRKLEIFFDHHIGYYDGKLRELEKWIKSFKLNSLIRRKITFWIKKLRGTNRFIDGQNKPESFKLEF